MQFSSILRRGASAIIIPTMFLASLHALPARADEGASDPDAGVARISVLNGNVAIQRGDAQTTVAAAVNAPVLGADYITTAEGARAEVQFDGHGAVRLGENVQMRFTRIDTRSREMQLAEGAIEVRLLGGVDGSTTVDTPSISVHPQEAGAYRISVLSDGTTQVTVRSGRADIETPQGNQSIASGSTLAASGAASNPQISSIDPIALDGFDEFNHGLDANEERSVAEQQYVSSDIQGVSDLQRYGRWVHDPSYGNVWVPNDVAPDWAPYRDGRWAWAPSYGYTWVAAEPWGWAPYHYGRWYHGAYGWGWTPPPVAYAVPAWSPALVGFIGFGGGGGFNGGVSFGGGGIGINFAFGNVGWVPLGPSDPFRPWWGRGGYVNNSTNITNVTNVYNNNTYNGNGVNGGAGVPGTVYNTQRRTLGNTGTIVNGNVNITRIYQNARVANAVTGTSSANFNQGNFSRNVAIGSRQLAQAAPVRGALPIVPSQANLRYSNAAVPQTLAARAPLATTAFAGNRTVTQRVPFEAQRTTFAQAVKLNPAPLTLQNTATERVAPAALQRQTLSPTHTIAPATGGSLAPVTGRALTPGSGTAAASPETTRGAAWNRFGANRGTAAQLPAQTGVSAQTGGSALAPGVARSALGVNRAPATITPRAATSAQVNDPWTRFGTARNAAGTLEGPPTRSTLGRAVAPISGTAPAPYAGRATRRYPAANPAVPNEQGAAVQPYQRPSAVQPYQRPAAVQQYQRPAAVQQYQRPAAVQQYQRPAAVQQYQRPAASFPQPVRQMQAQPARQAPPQAVRQAQPQAERSNPVVRGGGQRPPR